MPNHTSNFVEIETNTGCSKEQLALHNLEPNSPFIMGSLILRE
jgi:hypothetical protein